MLYSRSRGFPGARFAVAIAAIALCAIHAAQAAPAGPELQKLVRAATFEVVLRKPTEERLTYEKPLPLDLLPFTERNDKYWSIGTAFATGPNQFVSAGHVIVQGLGSQFGAPALRDVQGNVYEIARITRFSLHEDFAVFALAKPPAVTALATNTSPQIDDAVFAVGNALGEGVVIRDGLLTSMTPEDQDGRWKWLRFSAAASPGNSGGPLLDASGKVIGIVIGRSPSENLNYGLPIERVLNASESKASMDTRSSFKLPMLIDTDVSVYKDSFDLPADYPEFSKRLLTSLTAHYKQEQERTFALHAAEIFPRGQSAKLLAHTVVPARPSLILQQDDRTWDEEEGSDAEDADLPDGGKVTIRFVKGMGLLTLKRPGNQSDPAFYKDSRAFMDFVLKGLRVPRPVGGQQIRITSFGAATQESTLTDRLGRRWLWRTWPLGFVDIEVHCFLLPSPQGFVGFLRYAPTAEHARIGAESAMLADLMQMPYGGTVAQWKQFLANDSVRPAALAHVKLAFDADKGFSFESPRLQMSVPPTLLKLTDTAVLRVDMALIADGEKVATNPARVTVSTDEDLKKYVTVGRQIKPAAGAGKEALSRWEDMESRKGIFAGAPGHDKDFNSFWVRSSVSAGPPGGPIDSSAGVLYDLGLQTDQQLLPREVDALKESLVKSVRVMEH